MKRKSSRIFRLLCTGTTLILASISPCEAFCVDRLALVPASATHRTAATLSRQQSQLHYHSLDDDDEYIYYQQVPLSEEEKYRQEVVNSFVVASRDSFKNVESATDFLLAKQPIVAFMIFIGAGLLVAYISGFFILGGYIDDINPALNNPVPYWDPKSHF